MPQIALTSERIHDILELMDSHTCQGNLWHFFKQFFLSNPKHKICRFFLIKPIFCGWYFSYARRPSTPSCENIRQIVFIRKTIMLHFAADIRSQCIQAPLRNSKSGCDRTNNSAICLLLPVLKQPQPVLFPKMP